MPRFTATRPRHHLLSMAAALACQGALAQATAPTERVEVIAPPLVEAQRVDAFGSLSTEVGATQVRDLQALDLSAALRRTPGVNVSRFNPVGSFGGDEGGAVYVRGLGASRPGSEVKTFVDGLPFYMGVWNHALLDLLPVHGMERIRVLKGPQPQVLGNTFAAIDMQPLQAKEAGVRGNLRLMGGSFGTLVEQADFSGRWGDVDLSVAQSHAESDGHREAAQGRLDNGLLRAAWRLSPEWSVGALLLSADNKVSDPGEEGLPASRTGQFSTRGTLSSLSVSHQHGTWRGRVQVYDNHGVGTWDNPQAAVTRSTFALRGWRWQETAQPWAGAELQAGWDVDHLDGSVAFNGFPAFEGVSMRLSAPHLALAQRWALSADWQIQPSVGVRLYDHSVYGRSTAPHAGLVLEQGQAWSWRINTSRGLSHPGLDAPLLNALVPPLAASPTGWRSLNPERMNHLEAGMQWRPQAGQTLDVALFKDTVSDRYVFAFPPAVALPSWTNLGRYEMRGAELSWQGRWSPQWSSHVNVTLLDPSRTDLPYAPERSLGLGLTWQAGPWRVSADGQAQSAMNTLSQARADGSSNAGRVGGFAVFSGRAAYAVPALGPRGEVFLGLENLGDKRYAYRPNYPMAGRAVQVGLNLSL